MAEDAGFVFNAYETATIDGKHDRYYWHLFGRRGRWGNLSATCSSDSTPPVWGTVMARPEQPTTLLVLFDPRYSWIADVEMWMRMNLRFRIGPCPRTVDGAHPP